MRLVKFSALAIAGLTIGLSTYDAVHAEAFVCKNVVVTRDMPGATSAAGNLAPAGAELYLDVNMAEPGRSTLRWSGVPGTRDGTSIWPPDTRILLGQGTIAAAFTASKNGFLSVGSVTLDADGELRAVESTVTAKGVIFDVVQANCRKGKD